MHQRRLRGVGNDLDVCEAAEFVGDRARVLVVRLHKWKSRRKTREARRGVPDGSWLRILDRPDFR